MKRLYTVILGAAALAVASGCSDEQVIYLSGPPGPATGINFSNSSVTVVVGDSAIISARAQDAAGNATADAVTLSACGAAVSVTGESSNESWTVLAYVKGAGLGSSCVLAQAAGLTDTIRVSVGPAGFKVVGPDTVGSGNAATFTVEAFDANGAALAGTTDYAFTSSNKARLAIDIPTGVAAGKSTGSVDVRVVAPGGANATKSVIVAPGVFAGALSAASGAPGAVITVTRAADGPQFDSDVGIRVGSTTAFVDLITPGAVTFGVPATGSTAAAVLSLLNMGPSQIAQITAFTVTAAAADKYQPGNITNDCSDPSAAPTWSAVKSPGGAVYFSHNGTTQGTRGCYNSGAVTGYDHFFVYTPTTDQTVDVLGYWTLAGDNDILVYSTDFSENPCVGFSGGTLNELDCTDAELTGGTSYFIVFSPWSANTGTNNVQIVIKPS